MVVYDQIGEIRSPYDHEAPFQPTPEDETFAIELEAEYAPGLADLATFNYAYVLYDLDRVDGHSLSITPPWRDEEEVGLFASRAPRRPNPIGMSVVEVLDVRENRIDIDAIDAFDGTPVLDVKPYVDGLDTRGDANAGWIDADDADDVEHLELHVKGIPH
jgi:tRNA-Thr(GGU) m(6)t(6)A37 methyltransferase TsaA